MNIDFHIAHAAIKRLDGVTAIGRSHAEIRSASPEGSCKVHYENEGFMTSKGRFLNRPSALWVAYEAGQLSMEFIEEAPTAYLLSDYLWKDNGFLYDEEKGYYKKEIK